MSQNNNILERMHKTFSKMNASLSEDSLQAWKADYSKVGDILQSYAKEFPHIFCVDVNYSSRKISLFLKTSCLQNLGISHSLFEKSFSDFSGEEKQGEKQGVRLFYLTHEVLLVGWRQALMRGSIKITYPSTIVKTTLERVGKFLQENMEEN